MAGTRIVAFLDLILIAATAEIAMRATLLVLASVRSRDEEHLRDPDARAGLRACVLASSVRTIVDIREQLRGEDPLVVADNCTDDTATVARSAGAEVIERDDPTARGKFALDFGLKHLRTDPPDVAVMVDTHCRVAAGSVARSAGACVRTGWPAQALDLMTALLDSAINVKIAEFAWRVRNWVRPLRLARLGLSCKLMGTGMDLAAARLSRTLSSGWDLSNRGPLRCSALPPRSPASFRRRGRSSLSTSLEIGMIVGRAPSLLFEGGTSR